MNRFYFLAADLLGFSTIVSNLSGEELEGRIESWVTLVNKIKPDTPTVRLQLISDTLFVREDGTRRGLECLLRFSRELLEQGMAMALPIRGAIAYGPVVWGGLTYGKAVIDAHRYEAVQEWVGIACAPKLPHIDQMWDWDRVVVYPIPVKSGQIQLAPTVVWTVPPVDELTRQTLDKGLSSAGEILRWEWQRKVINTSIFGRYVLNAKAKGLNPGAFAYRSPADA